MEKPVHRRAEEPAHRRVKEWPAGERPRERLRAIGASGLATRELLAILVGSGPRGRSAVAVGAELLTSAGDSLRELGCRGAAELERVPGVGPAVAARVAAALELGRRLAAESVAERPRIRGPRDIYELCAPTMRDLRHEEFRVLLLNSQHAVLREVVISRGILDASLVHPREVFKAAVAESAAALVLVHNHPSGDPTPSAEDREVTRQLMEAGRVLGIPVLDHVVVGEGRWVSLA